MSDEEQKNTGSKENNAKKHVISHPVIIFRCIQMLMQFETKHCIYFCIDSSLLQNLLKPGERELSSLGVDELAATRAASPISVSVPLGVLGPNSLLDESHVYPKRTI